LIFENVALTANSKEATPPLILDTADPRIEVRRSTPGVPFEAGIDSKTDDESDRIVLPYASSFVTVKLNGTPVNTGSTISDTWSFL
jgi:hypothetical protein